MSVGHVVVAGAAGLAAHHDGDDAALAVAHRRNEVEAGGAGVAGLDAVDALDAAEQAVVVGHALAAIGEGARREVPVILRKMLAQREAEDGEVARRRMLARGSGRPDAFWNSVPVMPSLLRLGRHHAREAVFRAADEFGDGRGRIVGRLGDQRIDDRLDADRSAGLDAELGRRPRRGMRGERHLGRLLDLARGEPLEDQIERHHLGERGRVARLAGVGRKQRLAGIGVDDDRRIFRVCRRCLGRPPKGRWPARSGIRSVGSQGRNCTATK